VSTYHTSRNQCISLKSSSKSRVLRPFGTIAAQRTTEEIWGSLIALRRLVLLLQETKLVISTAV